MVRDAGFEPASATNFTKEFNNSSASDTEKARIGGCQYEQMA
jgi:hypothetical protein